MRKSHLFGMMLICAVAALFATSAKATIYLDEDFEGTSAFVDQAFPIQDNAVTAPTAAIIAVQGINLRSWDDSGDFSDPPVQITNTGAVVDTRFFRGAKSLELASGKSVGPPPVQFPSPQLNWHRFWQFAVSTDAATAALAEGTVVGHFLVDYSTNATDNDDVDVTITVNFVVNASGGVDAILDNSGTTLFALTGVPGNWHLLSIIQMKRTDDTVAWEAFDPLTNTFKGPQPLVADPFAEADPNLQSLYFEPTAGVYYYVDANTTTTQLTDTDIGSNWGFASGGDAATEQTEEVRWELAATNGGTLYIDDLYWDGGLHQQVTRLFEREQAARISPFDAATTEPSGPIVPGEAAVQPGTWVLY